MSNTDPLSGHQADVDYTRAKTKLLNGLSGLVGGLLLAVLVATVVGSIVVLR